MSNFLNRMGFPDAETVTEMHKHWPKEQSARESPFYQMDNFIADLRDIWTDFKRTILRRK